MSSARMLGLGSVLRQAALKPRGWIYAANALRMVVPKRGIKTQSLPPSSMTEILNTQRLKRPSSPHFTIYQPQLTWLGSIANRMTGSALSVLLYGYALAYLVAPGTFDSAHVIEFVAGLPDAVKYTGKAILAAPFAFHSWNGLRHLSWDAGKFLSLKGAYQSGYAVLGATAVTTVALVLM
ncbi:SDHC, cytochrome b subunit of succinate dehydrogenase [Rhodofomes roseus]|uniref:SDHC, cytochrome b subunit of succinate dehydrogenase n=2 Tax=Rhodofomes roseus TaxID=34475 RepID=A0ABQ8KLE0_9APHY|nr:SDHC, cytochrome b subunit of succinate dehydrogenase [Rhodofomes roseus]KAH9838713.1 SDHC, cytochrome b subunit of succinate dehydrogenase [Rhodofomes roseus]